MGNEATQNVLDLSLEDMEVFPAETLRDGSCTDFDLYVDVGGRPTLYGKAPYTWSQSELERLKHQGFTTLYYSTADRDKVEAYKAIQAVDDVPQDAPPRQRITKLTDAAAELTRVLYDYQLTDASLNKGHEVASSMVSCVQEDISCVSALGKLASHDDYTYYHSARVAAYAIAIALQMSQRDPAALQDLAIGCLLHDVGKSKIDLTVLNKTGALTKEEMEFMKQHPVFGYEIVSQSRLPLVPRSIILHHHERLDGTGYPHNLTEHELLEEVKIASFSDVFDALTTNRPYQASRSRFEALDFIRHRLLKNLHQESFEAIVQILRDDAGE